MELFVAVVIVCNLVILGYCKGNLISQAFLTKNTPTSRTSVCKSSYVTDKWKDLLAECRQKTETLKHKITSEQAQETTTPSEETTTPGPIYRGCYKDGLPRILPYGYLVNRSAMTIDLCRLHCIKEGYYSFFGLQAGQECFCSNEIKRGYSKVSDNECNRLCRGEPTKTCGGHWRIAIYQFP